MYNVNLIGVKEKLIHILNDSNRMSCDNEQLEYLIKYVDWLILGDIKITADSLLVLTEEIVTTAVHQLDLDLLDVLKDLGNIEETYCGNEI